MKFKVRYIVLLLIISIGILGISYAFYEYYKIGENHQLIVGNIYLKFNEGTDTLSLSNIFPETAEKARARTDNEITFTISGLNTTTDQDIYYEIMLNEGDEESGKLRAKPENLMFDLIEIDQYGNETLVISAGSYEDINERTILVNTVDKDTTSEISFTYKLRMWLSEDVIISDTLEGADYTTDDFANSYASVKVSVYGDFVEKEMTKFILSDIIENRLQLTEPDVDGTRFVYGSDVDNNYVWYSGKLWRILSLNSNGSVKLITENNITTIEWEPAGTDDYITSQARSWLNNVFLPTLDDSDNLVVNSTWDYTPYTSFSPDKPTSDDVLTNEKVGLITMYEFAMSGGTSSTDTTNTFLNSPYYSWTMTPGPTGAGLLAWCFYDGSITYNPTYFGMGIRPAINIISNIEIFGGAGKKDNPYIIKSNKDLGSENELLSNRTSGEYIYFNDVVYRIIGVEEINGKKFTKVTMSDYSVNKNTLTPNLAFAASTDEIVYSTNYGIGLYLNDWYNADSTSETYSSTYIEESYKKMIATSNDGVLWYQGPDEGISGNYTLAKTGTGISATIGLPSYGELFATRLNDGVYDSSTYIWFMTKESSASLIVNFPNDFIPTSYSPTASFGVRPCFYLKENVVIGDVDGDGYVGNGTLSKPYEIKLNE